MEFQTDGFQAQPRPQALAWAWKGEGKKESLVHTDRKFTCNFAGLLVMTHGDALMCYERGNYQHSTALELSSWCSITKGRI